MSPLDVLDNAVNITQSQLSSFILQPKSSSGARFEISDDVMYILLDIIKCQISIESTHWVILFNNQYYDWIIFNKHNTSELTTNRCFGVCKRVDILIRYNT